MKARLRGPTAAKSYKRILEKIYNLDYHGYSIRWWTRRSEEVGIGKRPKGKTTGNLNCTKTVRYVARRELSRENRG